MNIASVIVDIPTQALDTPYSYAVPDEMLVGEGGRPAAVGCAVLVTLGGRKAVGYIVGLEEVAPSPDEGTDLWGTPQSAADLKQVEAVLSAPFFDEEGAACALWLAERYAAPLSECARLFTPPRAVPRIVRGRDGRWRVEEPAIGEVDDRWVTRGPDFDAFVPRKNAVKQQEVLAAVGAGDVRVAELSREFGAVGSTLKALAAKGAVVVERRRRMRGMEGAGSAPGAALDAAAAPANRAAPSAAPQLTEGQKAAVAAIEAARAAGDGRVVLVDGVTGSGKTEVYLQAIERTLAEGRRAIVLVPEISLTPQTVARFRGRFGDAVAVMHSRMSDGERYDQWDFIKSGAAKVVVGARSALFTPAANVGLIVIDEEHEGVLQAGFLAALPRARRGRMDDGPGRRCAGARLGHPFHRVPLPSEQEPALDDGGAARARQRATHARHRGGGHGRRVRLRFPGHVLRTPRPGAGRGSSAQGRKAVLLLNQRGFAKFLLCRDCGFVPECPHCSTSLTYHEQGAKLICHHCGYTVGAPPVCPECGSPYLKKFGAGTQRVETELRQLLDGLPDVGPTVPIIRMDADTTQAKGAHQALLEEFAAADAAVLLGTQMIAKGLDFDDVTLVGVINADTQLHLPDYRAGERTFQLIEQVAGRAGRAELDGRVMVQTYEADDVAIRAAATYNRGMFLRAELPKRKLLGYPPYVRMANVLLWGADEHAVATEAEPPARPAGRACPQRGGGALAGAAGSALRAGEAAQHLPLPHRGEGAFGRRYLGAAGAPVPHA